MTRVNVCEECGREIEDMRHHRTTTIRFCSPKCRYRNRDRRRYESDPEAAKARARAYYRRNRQRVLERVKDYQRKKKDGE